MRRATVWVGGCLLLASSECFAQTSPTEVARRELLQNADAARAAGDHARALDLARRAGEIRMTPSVRLLLAQESEAMGALLEALDHASGCVREAEADATLRNRATILENCRALETALRPRLGSVVLHLDAPPPGTVIRMAGHEIPAALFGVPVRVMPGAVVVEVAGDGVEASREEVQVTAGASVDVTPQVRALERVVAHVESTATTQTASPPPVAASTPPVIVVRESGPGPAPWILVGLGAAAAVTGVVLFGLSESARSEREEACPNRRCPTNEAAARGLSAQERYEWQHNAGLPTLIAGAAVAVGGVLWYVLAPSGVQSAVRTAGRFQFTAQPDINGLSFGLRGEL